MYVIRRDDGAFVAPPGQRSSYTRDLTRARTFQTREAAERERCPENERVVHTDDVLPRPE
jgi:hypothetical protein